MRPMTCADVQELAAELALDLLTGTERAAALAHLSGCAACRSEVASLTDVGEAMLAIAPEVPPSAGFESRVISRISALNAEASTGQQRPARRRRVLVAAAAAVLAVVALAAALVVGAAGDSGDGRGAGGGTGEVAAADLLTSSGQVVGEATLREGNPAVVTVEMGDWVEHLRRYGESEHHSYWLTVGGQGEAAEAYALPLDEAGPWHVALDEGESAAGVTSVAVVDETGHTWCDARFTR